MLQIFVKCSLFYVNFFKRLHGVDRHLFERIAQVYFATNFKILKANL